MRTLKKQLTTISPLTVSLALFFAFVMTYAITRSFADIGPATLYTSPGGTQSVTKGNNFTVDVRISTASNVPVAGAIVYMTYPADKVSIQSVSYNGSPYNIEAVNDPNNPGELRMERLANPSTTGDQLFAKVTFKANNTGAAAIGFNSNSLAYSGDDGSSLTTSRNGVTYNINEPAPPPSSPPPSSPPPSSPPPSGSSPGAGGSTSSGSSSSSTSASGGSNSSPATPVGSGSATTGSADSNPAAPISEDPSAIAASNPSSTSLSEEAASLATTQGEISPWVIAAPVVIIAGVGAAFAFSRIVYPRLHALYVAKTPLGPSQAPLNQQFGMSYSKNMPKPGETFQPAQAAQPVKATALPVNNNPAPGTVIKGGPKAA